MTPEQIERLRQAFDEYDHGSYTDKLWVDDVRALLAEWEERGKQVEAFQRIVPRVEGERDAMYEEVERLSEQLRLCTVPDGWETWRRNAEAEIGRLKESQSACVRLGQFIGDKLDGGRIVSLEAEVQSCHVELATALAAQQDAEARLAEVVEIIEDMADSDPDGGTAWFHARCAAALAAAQPKEEK